MRLSFRSLSALSCAAVFSFAAVAAHADSFSVSGKFWASPASGLAASGPASSVPGSTGPGSAVYGTAATATFIVTDSSSTGLFNFDLNGASGDNNLYKFLTAGGDTVTGISSASAPGTDNIDQGLFQFTGTTALTNGTYDFTHDDGMLLYLTGIGAPVINSPGETVADDSSFCVNTNGTAGCVKAGTYSFTLDYAEVNGAPAVLTGDLPLTPSPTPEPSSILMLGTGLVGLAGMVRRRLAA